MGLKKFLKNFYFATDVCFVGDKSIIWQGNILDVPSTVYDNYKINTEGIKSGEWEPVWITHKHTNNKYATFCLNIEVTPKKKHRKDR